MTEFPDYMRNSIISELESRGLSWVDCTLCGLPTEYEGTKLCNRCYNVKNQVEANPHIAKKVLRQLENK